MTMEKPKKRAFRCHEGQALLELISEKDGMTVQDFSCIATERSGSSLFKACVPKPDSRYLTCQVLECPEGYYPVAIHMKDEESHREGFGFSCALVEETRTS
jgi:hypothetical protein